MIVDSNYIKSMAANFSIIVADEKKVPVSGWKDSQVQATPASKIIELAKKKNAHYLGIVTGYDGLEVIDVDLKVLELQKKKKSSGKTFIRYSIT